MIKAVVFDFDGTILDTETPVFRSFERIYREYGQELTLDVWSACVGTDDSKFDPRTYLESLLGRKVDWDVIENLRRTYYREMMQGKDVQPGIRERLAEARALGISVGLASSSPRSWVEGYLRQFGLLDYFDAIRGKDDVERVKPAPDLYLRALSDLGAAPDEAVAIEDSPNGALAAKTAGMRVVVVPNELTAGFRFGEVDLRLASLADHSWQDIFRSLDRRQV